MDQIIFVVTMVLCGILFLILGLLLWKKQKIGLIHDYHYKRVKEEDKKSYTAIMGKAMITMGIGMAVSGIVGAFVDSALTGIPFGVAFLIGLVWMSYGQMKYNKGIF